jgi:hypothetical protein
MAMGPHSHSQRPLVKDRGKYLDTAIAPKEIEVSKVVLALMH